MKARAKKMKGRSMWKKEGRKKEWRKGPNQEKDHFKK